ncbi:MAG: hypothetical protein ACLR7M_08485, partial [Varibaculum timonense]
NVCAGNTGYGVYSLTLRSSPHWKLFLVRAFSYFRGVLPGGNMFALCAIPGQYKTIKDAERQNAGV